jgi:peptidoglycan/LPS O-acetylase OafA/YrhL
MGMKSDSQRSYRPEIQFLRMVAVLAVILYHLGVSGIEGGFTGVDIFFVISGYLITGKILREVDQTGRFILSKFYANRCRRILPAGLLCIGVTAIVAMLYMPIAWAINIFREALASIFYVQNWYLANSSVSYEAQSDPKTPFNHLWSLGIEEQFYIILPILILLAILIGRKIFRLSNNGLAANYTHNTVFTKTYSDTSAPDTTTNNVGLAGDSLDANSVRASYTNALPQSGPPLLETNTSAIRKIALFLVVALTLFSFVYNLLLASGAGSNALYFMTTSRAWELGVGSILAFIPIKLKGRFSSIVLFWGGIALIFLGFTIIQFTPNYPGSNGLLPLVGAVLVILSSCYNPEIDLKKVAATTGSVAVTATSGSVSSKIDVTTETIDSAANNLKSAIVVEEIDSNNSEVVTANSRIVRVGEKVAASTANAAPNATVKISDAIIRFPLFQYLGNISYSLYLWHWPLIILYPWIKNDWEIGWLDKLAIFLLAVLLASISYFLVENPIRFSPFLKRKTALSLVGSFAVMGILVGVVYLPYSSAETKLTQRQAELSPTNTSETVPPDGDRNSLNPASNMVFEGFKAESLVDFGGNYMIEQQKVFGIYDQTNLSPDMLTGFDPSFVDASLNKIITPDPLAPLGFSSSARIPLTGQEQRHCNGDGDDDTPVCIYSPREIPTRTIALVGDSQIGPYFLAFSILAEKHGWEIQTYFHQRCGFLAYPNWADPQNCFTANLKTASRLVESKPDLIVVAQMPAWDSEQGQTVDTAVEGFLEFANQFNQAGLTTLVINSPPRIEAPPDSYPHIECLTVNYDQPKECAFGPAEWGWNELQFNQRVGEQLQGNSQVIDLNSSICINWDYFSSSYEKLKKAKCFYVVGNVLTYRDVSHITSQFAVSQIPLFEPKLLELLGE